MSDTPRCWRKLEIFTVETLASRIERDLAAATARAEKAECEMLAQASRQAAEMQMRRDCEAMALRELDAEREARKSSDALCAMYRDQCDVSQYVNRLEAITRQRDELRDSILDLCACPDCEGRDHCTVDCPWLPSLERAGDGWARLAVLVKALREAAK